MKLNKFLVAFFFIPFLSILGQEDGRMTFTLRNEKGKIMEEYSLLLVNGKQLYDSVLVRYYPNGKMKDSCYYEKGVIVGGAYTFDKKERVASITEFNEMSFPREINFQTFFYSGACRKIEGKLIETEIWRRRKNRHLEVLLEKRKNYGFGNI